ncbi:MAG TPA: uracil-DNA glycosylase [Thioalkalivibrio sp.]|nr:uracil-DNA glycosylase [Thioalkalivibrio sp.]
MRDERQRRYLEAMGIPLWAPRKPLTRAAVRAAEPSAPAPEPVAAPATPEPVSRAVSPPRREGGASAPPPAATPAPLPDTSRPPGGAPDIATLDLDGLREQVAACARCAELAATRTQTVFGVGNPDADWLVIGEAPGAEEDRRGEPFVGRAGQLLDAMLAAIALDRQQAYIANILKCRPPNNRDPRPEEAANCRPWLDRQIALIHPKLILVVGRIAAQALLGTDAPLASLRGQVHRLPGTGLPVIVTYHPAYLLRTPKDKRKAWADLKLARQVMAAEAG